MSRNMFEGEKVRLRGVRPDDWEHFLRWDQDSDAQRHGYQVWPPQGTEAAKAFAREQSETKPTSRIFLVIETLAGEAVGSINLRPDERRRSFEYGINVDRNHGGKGYATEAAVMGFRYMFAELAYHKAHAYVYAFNEASVALHRRLGMRLEGTLSEAVFTDGRYWDCLVFGMIDREFYDRYGDSWGQPLR